MQNAATRNALISKKEKKKKKGGRAYHVNMRVPRIRMGESGERTLLVDTIRDRGRECLCWQSSPPPGGMVTGHSISYISSNNKQI